MKRLRKLLAILTVSTMLMSLMTITTSAANYTPVAGGSTTFNKYLVVENGADVPNVTFTFSIDAGTPIAAGSGTMEVLAGPVVKNGQNEVTAPTVGTATFAPGDTVTQDDSSGTVTGVNNAYYASETGITVDFSGVTFPEPGVYRYTLSEDAVSAPYSISGFSSLTLDVYVTDNGSGLAVSSYVLHTDDDAPVAGTNNGSGDVNEAGAPLDTKTNHFTNVYATHDLTFSKTVSGNQASRDKYFKITVTADEVNTTDSFNVVLTGAEQTPLANAATTYTAQQMGNNPGTVTGAQLNAGVDFYVKHGQSIVIKGLPAGTNYAVEEVAEDYKPTLAVTGDNDATATTTSAEGDLDADVTAAFTNTRDGVIPTGVLLKIAPFAVGILLFGAMFIFMVSKRRREAY